MPHLASGISVLDRAWEGLRSGATYVAAGRAESRAPVLLRILQAAVDAGQTCVFVADTAPADLVQRASALDFDVQTAVQAKRLHLLRAPALPDGPDATLARAMGSIAHIAAQSAPALLVIDDFAPFLGFTDAGQRTASLERLVNAMRAHPTALLLGIEAANDVPSPVVAEVGEAAAGALYVDRHTGGGLALRLTPGSDPALSAASGVWTPGATEAPSPDDGSGDGYAAQGGSVGNQVLANQQPPSAPASPPIIPIVDARPADPAAPQINPVDLAAVSFDVNPHLHAADFEFDGGVLMDSRRPEAGPVTLDGSRVDLSAGGTFRVPGAPPGDGMPMDFSGVPQFDAPNAAPPSAPPLPTPSAMPRFTSLAKHTFDSSPRGRFAKQLQLAFERFETEGIPFLALALRMDPDNPFAEAFPLVEEAVREATDDHDPIYAETERKRLLVLLPERTQQAVSAIFGAIKAQLQLSGGASDAVFTAIAAVAVPNGEPFANARDLMTFAFDTD